MDIAKTLAQVRAEITKLQAVEYALVNCLGPRRGRPPKRDPLVEEVAKRNGKGK